MTDELKPLFNLRLTGTLEFSGTVKILFSVICLKLPFRKMLLDIGLGNEFLHVTPKAQATKI